MRWNVIVYRNMMDAKKVGDWTLFYYWQEMFE